MTGATEHSYFQAKGKKAFPNLIKKLNVQFPPARILFLIFIYIVSLFQESQNNGFPQILQKKKKKTFSQQRRGQAWQGRSSEEGQEVASRVAAGARAGSAQAEGSSEAAPSFADSPRASLLFAASGSSRDDSDAPLVSLTSFKSNYFHLNSHFSPKNPRERWQ